MDPKQTWLLGGRVARHTVRIKRLALALATGLAMGLAGAVPASAQLPPPDEDWRTISTERARITFPARLEALARRAAYHTEEALDALQAEFLAAPDGTIDVLLTDHTDISNGFAGVAPSNRVTIFARPPVDDPNLGYFDDWLELVITHELAHIVHLDHTSIWFGRILRSVFGRTTAEWPFFPGLGTPRLITEGLATWYETALTGEGRTHGTFHEMQLRTAVLEGRFEDIGQAAGTSPVWPAGNRPYAYGSLFFDHLLERHGEDRMAVFADAVAGQWIPYRLDAAGRDAFGATLSEEWAEWSDSLRERYRSFDDEIEIRFGPVTEPERLTEGARFAVEPVVAPDGTLAYVRSDGRTDSRIVLEQLAAGASDRSIRVNGIGSLDWMADGRLLVSQMEFSDLRRQFSDLYLFKRDGDVRRITRGARLSQPSAEPGGRSAVAVRDGAGTRALVRVDLETGGTTALVPTVAGEHWAYPAVSPDGTWVAATRWRTGAFHDIVVLDARTGEVIVEVTRDRAIDLAPSWSPDGRWIVWASDRSGILNVHAAEFDPATGRAGRPRMLTNVRTGVNFPSVSPDGRSVVVSLYDVDGWDVARVPFEPEAAPLAPEPTDRFVDPLPYTDGIAGGPVEDYSPWPTLLPTYWEPETREAVRSPVVSSTGSVLRTREVLGFAVGASTSGRDLVGRHAYGLALRAFTSGGKIEGSAVYSYSGLQNPVFSVGVTQSWDDDGSRLGQTGETTPPDTLFVLERERSAFGSVTLASRTWRTNAALTLTGSFVHQARELLDNDLDRTDRFQFDRPIAELGDLRASLTVSTARSHAFQMGATRGVSLFLSGRTRETFSLPDSLAGVRGLDRSLDDLLGLVRGYLPLGGPGHASHVFAVRVAGGTARGPGAFRGHFNVGGASGRKEDLTGLTLYGGSPVFFPVRGYSTTDRAGRRAWTASGEYRFPIRIVHQGAGVWPLYLGRVVGTLFMDAGDAWDPGTDEPFFSSGRNPLVSVGGEVGAELLAIYDTPLFTRFGIARALSDDRGTSVFVRLGVSF